MRLREKILWIVLVVLVIGGLVVVPVGKVIYDKTQKPIREEERLQLEKELEYNRQNRVFSHFKFGRENDMENPYYMSYKELVVDENTEKGLYIAIKAYIHECEEELSLKDIKDFLSESTNEDGTPKTYSDDKTGKIKKFVEWHNSYNVSSYTDKLNRIFADYCKTHSDFPSSSICDLTFEQIDLLDLVLNEEKELDEIEL